MAASITIKPVAGIVALMCPACKRLNHEVHHHAYDGTIFVPLNLTEKAFVEAGRGSILRSLLCHEWKHRVTVAIAL